MLVLTKGGKKLGPKELDKALAGWGACGQNLCHTHCGTGDNTTDFNFSVSFKLWWAKDFDN